MGLRAVNQVVQRGGFFRRGKFRTGNIPHLSQKIKGEFRTSYILRALERRGSCIFGVAFMMCI